MKNISKLVLSMVFILAVVKYDYAREYQGNDMNNKSSGLKETSAGCSPSSAFEWLDINNVRARVNAGGDMWWDLDGISRYYVPKSGSATSMFSGALWIGGLDINNQLKLAAQRFRQGPELNGGVDFWTGPLTIDGTAAIDETVCAQYDRLFKMNRALVDEFLSHTDPITGAFIPSDDYTIPTEILEWPAHADISKKQSYYLAPFYDVDGDGEYNPFAGDYPYYDIDNSLCHTKTPTMDESIEGSIQGSILADQVIKGDQTLWWVFNDKGNIHTDSEGAAIGLEIRGQAFAFATNDEVNNMTFYSYEIINRSTFELTETYFSPWVDPDLGYAQDDYVGCDVGRGLGYAYNGTAVDGSGEPEAYGEQPPAIGVDFFQGPYLDPDGQDNPKYRFITDPATGDTIGREQLCDVSINGVNFGNGIKDDERYGMRRFVYYNNNNDPINGEPRQAGHYYNYLRGIWKNGQKMRYGGDAVNTGVLEDVTADFMFPFDSDPCNWGTNGVNPEGYNNDGVYWSEESENNPPADRRFMQSAGPFTLKPGAVNYITVGIPWARAVSGGPFASVELLRRVDDKAQTLFDNCFKVIDGPNAPDLSFQELDKELIVYISNSPSSNNFGESYQEFDPNIIQPHPDDPTKRSDSLYRFEGYQIFQLKDPTVGVESIHDPDKVRLVAQFDKKNGVSKLVNFYYDEMVEANIPVVEVNGGDNGIQHSFKLSQDAFAQGDVRLVNHKQYYYMAIAYAYNEFMPYSQEPGVLNGLLGQKAPYLAGRKNIKTYTAIPHKTINGLVANAEYGEGPEITRLAGHGNGGMELELKPEVIDEILSKDPASEDNIFGSPTYPIAYNPVYMEGYGPINVKVVDPLNVVSAEYELAFDSLRFIRLYNVTGDPAVRGDTASKYISNWVLRDVNTGETYTSDTTTLEDYEQLFLDRGISITIKQPYKPGVYKVGNNTDNQFYERSLAPNNGFITANIIYKDSSRRWLDGIRDDDIPGSPLDWIRSGTYKDQDNSAAMPEDWRMSYSQTVPDRPWDANEDFEQILFGTWAPYALTTYGNTYVPSEPSQSTVGPAYSRDSKANNSLNDLFSVDIVLTPDKSKWSRSPVLEMSYDQVLAEGNAPRFSLRKAPSVDKEGNPAASMDMEASDNPDDPNYIGSYGMSWFPGYAINVETGERLNIMFGEDSYLAEQNGRDMLFNPPPRDMDLSQPGDPNIITQVSNKPVMGGKHYVYIMGHEYRSVSIAQVNIEFKSPAYDAGRYAFGVLDTLFTAVSPVMPMVSSYFYTAIKYVGMPMPVKGQEWLNNEARIRIRVAKPYVRYYSSLPLDTVYDGMDVNRFYPKYAFNTQGIATEYRDPEKLQTDLDLINVVPNPYYAYSSYERNALDNRIKITNLPEQCVITIYNMSGTRIRQFKKDEPKTSIDWDLKNFAGVPIASGIYLIHVKSEDGERVIKWFGSMRPMDLNTF